MKYCTSCKNSSLIGDEFYCNKKNKQLDIHQEACNKWEKQEWNSFSLFLIFIFIWSILVLIFI